MSKTKTITCLCSFSPGLSIIIIISKEFHVLVWPNAQFRLYSSFPPLVNLQNKIKLFKFIHTAVCMHKWLYKISHLFTLKLFDAVELDFHKLIFRKTKRSNCKVAQVFNVQFSSKVLLLLVHDAKFQCVLRAIIPFINTENES